MPPLLPPSQIKPMPNQYANAPMVVKDIPAKANIPKVKEINYAKEIAKMGVRFENKPTNPEIYKHTHEVLQKIKEKSTKKKKLNFKIKFHDDNFEVDNPILADPKYVLQNNFDPMTGERYAPDKIPKTKAGGAWYAKKKQISIVTNHSDMEMYKSRLAHEVAHALGVKTGPDAEHIADAFAAQFYPSKYGYLNNPYIKESWQPGYVPPVNILPPGFPKY